MSDEPRCQRCGEPRPLANLTLVDQEGQVCPECLYRQAERASRSQRLVQAQETIQRVGQWLPGRAPKVVPLRGRKPRRP